MVRVLLNIYSFEMAIGLLEQQTIRMRIRLMERLDAVNGLF
jgi:hypothetical protein